MTYCILIQIIHGRCIRIGNQLNLLNIYYYNQIRDRGMEGIWKKLFQINLMIFASLKRAANVSVVFMTRRNNMYLIRNRNGGKVCREHA